MERKNTNIVWHEPVITRELREQQNGHRSAVLWFTGLSGAGKSTVAHAVEDALYQRACRTFVLDGDNVRHGLCKDLGFSIADRTENIRRVGEVSKLFTEAGIIVLTAFISPLRSDRDSVRAILQPKDFFEIHCAAALDVCERRDVKGLYKKARAGEIKEFTGISSPYEAPLDPELVLDTGKMTVEEAVLAVLNLLKIKQVIK